MAPQEENHQKRCECLVQQAIALFFERFPELQHQLSPAQLVIAAAPGRVNLIGEHTDYNDGFVLPLALDRNTVIVGVRAPSSLPNVTRVVTSMEPDPVCFQADATLKPDPALRWANYIKGVAFKYFEQCHAKEQLPNLNVYAAIATRVPLGGGLSSSASLEVAYATFLEAVFGLQLDKTQRALWCQWCEHHFCNVPCGIMDQFISSCGLKDHALLIDCRTRQATPVPFEDPNVCIVVSNSNVKHELVGTEYKDRVKQCQSAVKALQSQFTGISHLRDATLDQLDQVNAMSGLLDPIAYRRARHVIGENLRTVQTMELVVKKDYVAAGKLMYASHESLRSDYEVSTPQLDALVEIARGFEGVYGARMTGGGFGGCIVVLMRADRADALIELLDTDGYPASIFGAHHNYPHPSSFKTSIGSGARVLKTADQQDHVCV